MKLSDLQTSEQVLANELKDPGFCAEWTRTTVARSLRCMCLLTGRRTTCHSVRWRAGSTCRNRKSLGLRLESTIRRSKRFSVSPTSLAQSSTSGFRQDIWNRR